MKTTYFFDEIFFVFLCFKVHFFNGKIGTFTDNILGDKYISGVIFYEIQPMKFRVSKY